MYTICITKYKTYIYFRITKYACLNYITATGGEHRILCQSELSQTRPFQLDSRNVQSIYAFVNYAQRLNLPPIVFCRVKS